MEVDRVAGVIRFNPWEQNLTGDEPLPREIPLSDVAHWLGVVCAANDRAEAVADECIRRIGSQGTATIIPQTRDVFLHATQLDILAGGLERAVGSL